MNIYDIQERINYLQEDIAASSDTLPASRFGLDDRCGYLMLGDTFIASSAPRMLDYYGGFEYVDAEHITQVGTWKVYSTDCERVQAAWEQASDL